VATHSLRSSFGEEFLLHVDNEGRIVQVDGPWPDEADVEFDLEGQLPRFRAPENLPDHVVRYATGRGLWVCYYDDVRCQTCYCDGSGKTVRCVRHC
jgi:hypothetical protein